MNETDWSDDMVLFTPSFRMVRAEDHLVVDVLVDGLERTQVTGPSGPRHVLTVAPNREFGVIWVRMPSQQVLEYATPAAAPSGPSLVRAAQNQPIYGPATDLVVRVVKSDPPVELTVAGILDALRRSALHVPLDHPTLPAPTATLPARATAHELLAGAAAGDPSSPRARQAERTRRALRSGRRRVDALTVPPLDGSSKGLTTPEGRSPTHAADPASHATRVPPPDDPTVPASGATAAAASLSGPPPGKSVIAFPRRLAPQLPGGDGPRWNHATQPATHEGRTELWTTRFGRRSATPGGPFSEDAIAVRLEALTKHPNPPAELGENLLVHSLLDAECDLLATQSVSSPFRLEDLALSSAGGWLTLDTGNAAAATEAQFRHETRQGRDQYQQVVLVGRLLPFGNLAILTSTTTREFETGNKRAAALETVATVDIRQPTTTYPATKVVTVVNDEGDPVQVTTGVPWPYASLTVKPGPAGVKLDVELTTLKRFVVGGRDWPFEVVATDRAGRTSTLRVPMLFAPGTGAVTATGLAKWAERFGKTLTLDGESLAVTPLPDGNQTTGGQRAVPPSPDATSVKVRELTLDLADTLQPKVTSMLARVPSVDGLVPSMGEVELSYAQPFVENAFTAANEVGQVFLQMATKEAQKAVVALGAEAAGGLAAVKLPIAGLSAAYGAVAGRLDDATQLAADLETLATGKLDLNFLTRAGQNLLGLVPLSDLIDLDVPPSLEEAQEITSDAVDGVVTRTVRTNLKLFKRNPQGQPMPLGRSFFRLSARPGNSDPRLNITQVLTADATASEVHSTTRCEIKDLELAVFFRNQEGEPGEPPPNDEPIVVVPLKSVSFTQRDTQKPEIDVEFAAVRFGGILEYVGVLAQLIDDLGLIDPPAITVGPDKAVSSFSFEVPTIAVGMFALENITFVTSLELNFSKQPALLLIVAFSSFDHPFGLTVSLLRGGGYLRIGAANDGLALIEGSLSFGAVPGLVHRRRDAARDRLQRRRQRRDRPRTRPPVDAGRARPRGIPHRAAGGARRR